MKWPGLPRRKPFFPISEWEFKWKTSLLIELDIWVSPAASVAHRVKVGEPFTLSPHSSPFPSPCIKRGHSCLLDPSSLSSGQGVSHTPPPFRHVPFSLSRGGKRYTQAALCHRVFFFFPCPGLCSGSLWKLSACSLAFFWKSGLLNWLLISSPIRLLPAPQFLDPSFPVTLPARAAPRCFYLEEGSGSPGGSPSPLHPAPYPDERTGEVPKKQKTADWKVLTERSKYLYLKSNEAIENKNAGLGWRSHHLLYIILHVCNSVIKWVEILFPK